jgi:hypothetical protein
MRQLELLLLSSLSKAASRLLRFLGQQRDGRASQNPNSLRYEIRREQLINNYDNDDLLMIRLSRQTSHNKPQSKR